jgi:hypothetical protein
LTEWALPLVRIGVTQIGDGSLVRFLLVKRKYRGCRNTEFNKASWVEMLWGFQHVRSSHFPKESKWN